jgi:hypothetical protein
MGEDNAENLERPWIPLNSDDSFHFFKLLTFPINRGICFSLWVDTRKKNRDKTAFLRTV